MWAVPNQFKCIKDEDKRSKLISENLLTKSSKEFRSSSYHPIKIWANEAHKWERFINVADNIDEYLQTINKSGLSLVHEEQSITQDKYEDMPLISISTLKGKYIYTSIDGWSKEIKLKSFDSKKQNRWPTPLASDCNFFRMNKPLVETSWGTLEQRNLGVGLPSCVHWDSKKYKTHQINPRWVEQMMGLPIGWTDPHL